MHIIYIVIRDVECEKRNGIKRCHQYSTEQHNENERWLKEKVSERKRDKETHKNADSIFDAIHEVSVIKIKYSTLNEYATNKGNGMYPVAV